MSLTVGAPFPQHPPLSWKHSVAVSLCGLFPFCTNPLPHHRYLLLRIASVPCLTVGSFLHVCLTLCHCCPCKMHSLMLRVNPTPLKLFSTFPADIHICWLVCHMVLLSAYWQTFVYVWSSHIASLWNYSLSISVLWSVVLWCSSLPFRAEFRFPNYLLKLQQHSILTCSWLHVCLYRISSLWLAWAAHLFLTHSSF